MHISNKNSRIKRDYFLKDNKLENVDCKKNTLVFIFKVAYTGLSIQIIYAKTVIKSLEC